MTFEEVQARLQLIVMETAQLPDEQYAKVMARVAGLEEGLLKVHDAILSLNVLFGIAMPKEGDEVTAEPPLCSGCANPCLKASPEVTNCHQFSTFLREKCITCQNWDVDTCQLPEPCIDGQHYVAMEPEAVDGEGGLKV